MNNESLSSGLVNETTSTIDLYNLLEDIRDIDINYLYESINNNSSIDNTISKYDIDIVRSKGFTLSNPTLSSTLFIGLDKKGNQWYADFSEGRYVSFTMIKPKGERGLLFSSRTFTRSEFEQEF